MRLIIFVFLLVLTAAPLAWEQYPGSEKEAINSDPVEAAKISFKKGDFSLIIVADCFMGIPGYEGSAPPDVRPRVLGRTCDEMFDIDGTENVEVLKEWARIYNAHIQQHNKAPKPTQ